LLFYARDSISAGIILQATEDSRFLAAAYRHLLSSYRVRAFTFHAGHAIFTAATCLSTPEGVVQGNRTSAARKPFWFPLPRPTHRLPFSSCHSRFNISATPLLPRLLPTSRPSDAAYTDAIFSSVFVRATAGRRDMPLAIPPMPSTNYDAITTAPSGGRPCERHVLECPSSHRRWRRTFTIPTARSVGMPLVMEF